MIWNSTYIFSVINSYDSPFYVGLWSQRGYLLTFFNCVSFWLLSYCRKFEGERLPVDHHSCVTSSPAYGIFISQLIRYPRACSSYECFILSSSDRDMSGNVWNRPSGSFMVDMGISSHIMKSPSPKCYMAFWDMPIYSNILNWSDITCTSKCELITELDLITDFDLVTKFREVSIEHCNGCI